MLSVVCLRAMGRGILYKICFAVFGTLDIKGVAQAGVVAVVAFTCCFLGKTWLLTCDENQIICYLKSLLNR